MVCTVWCATIWAAIPRAATFLNVLSTAPTAAARGTRQVRITHPFHPLSGKRFDLIEHRCSFGLSLLYFHDDSGRLREIPAVWTDFEKGDAWVELAAGRARPCMPNACWNWPIGYSPWREELGIDV
jgi:Family of unknown function (DUF5372)